MNLHLAAVKVLLPSQLVPWFLGGLPCVLVQGLWVRLVLPVGMVLLAPGKVALVNRVLPVELVLVVRMVLLVLWHS